MNITSGSVIIARVHKMSSMGGLFVTESDIGKKNIFVVLEIKHNNHASNFVQCLTDKGILNIYFGTDMPYMKVI